MIATPQAEIGPDAYSEKWYAYRTFDPERTERPVIIGGSDAAAALGRSKYTSPLELFLRLRGELPPIESNKAMERGKRWERFILEEYEEDEQAELAYDQPMYFSRHFPWMAVTPDALRVDLPRGVDAKSSRHMMRDRSGEDIHKYGEPGTDQVPIGNLCQAMQYCVVLGVNEVDFPVLFGGDQLHTYTVQREPALCELLVKAEAEMAERVVNNDPPEPAWEMSGTRKLLQDLYGFEPDKRTMLSEQAAELWREVGRLQEESKRIEEAVETGKAKILSEMQGAEIGVFPGGKQGIKRVRVKDTIWTSRDITIASDNLGKVKRQGHERMMACKV